LAEPSRPIGAPASSGGLADEAAALLFVVVFCVIEIVGMVSSIFIDVFAFHGLFPIPGGRPTPTQAQSVLDFFQSGGVLLVVVGIATVFVSLGLLTMAFSGLPKVDRRAFRIPSMLMLELIGSSFLFFGLAMIVATFPQLASQTAGQTSYPPALSHNLMVTLTEDIAILTIGSLMGLVGLVGGPILGFWRIGTRYGEPVMKVGSIFTVIPLLQFIAPILVLVGALEARGRLIRQQSTK